MTTMTLQPEVELWSAHFGAVREGSPGESPAVTVLRDEAAARFLAAGFPTTADEEWKLTSVAPIARGAWRLPDSGISSSMGTDVESQRLGDEVAAELVFINGAFVPSLSSVDLPEGIRFRPLREALVTPDWELELLGRIARTTDRPFTDLNTATMRDGASIDVAPGFRGSAIHLIFLTSAENGIAATPRVLLRAGRGSEITLIESHAGRGSYFTNAVTEILADDGAVVDHYRIIREGSEGHHVGSIDVLQNRDSWFRSRLIGLGGKLVRTDIDATLDGPGAGCSLDGLYLLRGRDHFDAHTRIIHAKPHTESLELYKGILNDASRGVFNGIIVVRPDAQKITSGQVNKNLLLSNEAIADSNPQLEIHADDVKCSHGSTIGQLDETALFYLQTRGIGLEQARGMLTYAFASEVLERMRIESIRKRLAGSLLEILPLPASMEES